MKRKNLSISVFLTTILVVGMLFGVRLAQAAPPRAAAPSFGDVTIATDYSEYTFEATGTLDKYPVGLKAIAALLSVQGLPDNSVINVEWFQDGKSRSNISKVDVDLSTTVVANTLRFDSTSAGLTAGNWEADFTYKGQKVGTGKFVVTDIGVIYTFRFGTDVSHINYDLINPGTKFPSGTQNIVAVYRYYNLAKNTQGEAQWFHDGTADIKYPVTFDGTEGIASANISNSKGLPDGEWELKLVIDGNVIQSDKVTIGG